MKNRVKIILTGCIVLVVLIATATGGGGFRKEKKNEKKEEEWASGSVMDETRIGVLTGEDPWEEIKKLVQNYYGEGSQISYSGKMRLLDDNEETQKLLEEYDFEYSFCNGQYYYSIGMFECVSKADLLVMVNHADKSVSVSGVVPQKQGPVSFIDMDLFVKMMERAGAAAKVSLSGHQKILTVNNISDPSVQGYQVFYDPASYRIQKILVGMIRFEPLDPEDDLQGVAGNEQIVMEPENIDTGEFETEGYAYMLEISYDKYTLTAISEKDFHPENKFIRINGRKVELAEAFKNYLLTN